MGVSQEFMMRRNQVVLFYKHNNKGHYHLGSKNLDHVCDSGLLEGLGLDKNKEMNNCIVGRKPLFTMHKTK